LLSQASCSAFTVLKSRYFYIDDIGIITATITGMNTTSSNLAILCNSGGTIYCIFRFASLSFIQRGNEFCMKPNFVTLQQTYAKNIFEADSLSSDQKFFMCYGIQKFTAVFIAAHTWNLSAASTLTLILPRSRTETVCFYTSTSNKSAARPKLYTKSLTGDLKLMYSRLTVVRISINL
jgi:hypothetical protein